MRRVGVEERRARLAIRHGLTTPLSSPVEAADAMVGLHSSDPATVFLSCWARVEGFQPADLETALYTDKSLLRILGMRRTMWVVPTPFAHVVNSSSTIAHADYQRRRTQQLIESSGVTNKGKEWVRQVSEATIAALNSRGEATARELTEDVPEFAEQIPYYKKDGSLTGTFGMSTRILFLLSTEGRIVRTRPKGTWISSQYRWALMETWLDNDLEIIDQASAQADTLRLWLHAFGPATEFDMKWWSGWTMGQVRKTLATLEAVEVELDEGVGYLLPDDTEPVAAPDSWVALLPGLDPTTMGWKQRDWYLGDRGDQLFDRNGNGGPSVWVNGELVGGWAQRKGGEVVVELVQDVGQEASDAIGVRAGQLQSWLGEIRVTPRFRSPLDKRLSA